MTDINWQAQFLEQINARLADLRQGQEHLRQEQGRFSDKIDRLAQGQVQLETRVGGLEQGQAQLSAKMDAAEARLEAKMDAGFREMRKFQWSILAILITTVLGTTIRSFLW